MDAFFHCREGARMDTRCLRIRLQALEKSIVNWTAKFAKCGSIGFSPGRVNQKSSCPFFAICLSILVMGLHVLG